MSNTFKNLAGHGKRVTPQTEPIVGRESDMAQNNAGGFTFQVGDFEQLRRFLILGSDGGTYYAGQRAHTYQNIACLQRCIAEDGKATVDLIVEISKAGRAPKNDPAIYALAACASANDLETRQYALAHLNSVCRIGTHLFHFNAFLKGMRGRSKAVNRAVEGWYTARDYNSLAYQLVKYQQRDGWSHRDLLRLVKPKTDDPVVSAMYAWAVGKEYDASLLPNVIKGYETAKGESTTPSAYVVKEYGLTREMLPTHWLNDVGIWEALLENMPVGALIRNLGKMTSIGVIKPLSTGLGHVLNKLGSESILKRARVHPIQLLTALATYRSGSGFRGSLTWNPVPQVTSALEDAFYKSFDNVESTGKRWLLGLDVSGSMSFSGHVGSLNLTPRELSGAMAMVTARSESQYHFMGFCDKFVPLDITANDSIQSVLGKISNLPFGRTDCSLPMVWALKNKVEVDPL